MGEEECKYHLGVCHFIETRGHRAAEVPCDRAQLGQCVGAALVSNERSSPLKNRKILRKVS
jgi:hypothetical protein